MLNFWPDPKSHISWSMPLANLHCQVKRHQSLAVGVAMLSEAFGPSPFQHAHMRRLYEVNDEQVEIAVRMTITPDASQAPAAAAPFW